MTKLILCVCFLALLLCGVNTALLVKMGAEMKEKGDKIESVKREVEKGFSNAQSLVGKTGGLVPSLPKALGQAKASPSAAGPGAGAEESTDDGPPSPPKLPKLPFKRP